MINCSIFKNTVSGPVSPLKPVITPLLLVLMLASPVQAENDKPQPYYGEERYPGWYPGKYPDPQKPHKCDKESATITTPTERFILNKDGTATDKATGLMWMRCSLGHTWSGTTCEGDTHRSTWDVALNRVKEFNSKGGFASYQDWRVPNMKELGSIVERACVSPAVNLEVFPATELWYYWSSTPSAGINKRGHVWKNKQQWGIDFWDGTENVSNFTKRRVRLVRDLNP